MPGTRRSPPSLASVLARTATPVYVVDARRRMVYLNPACESWVGLAADDLARTTCRYTTSPDLVGAEAVAARLCPPPECFAGQAASATVSPTAAAGAAKLVHFHPLTFDGDGVGVLAVAASAGPEGLIPPGEFHEPSPAELHQRLRVLRDELRQAHELHVVLGESAVAVRLREQLAAAAASRTSVQIVGPPRSGRHELARAIHYVAGGDAPFVALSCGLLDGELLLSTVEALEKAPTASGSMLLLRDVEQVAPDVRRELRNRLLMRGMSLRLAATTSADLVQRAGEGEFDSELAYALSAMTIVLPPLEQRRVDLPIIAQAVLEMWNRHGERQLAGFSAEALDQLAAYSWPGEMGELAAAVRLAHEKASGPLVQLADLPAAVRLPSGAAAPPRWRPIQLDQVLAEAERGIIRRALAHCRNNKARAARLLGLTRPRLYRRMVQLGLADGAGDQATISESAAPRDPDREGPPHASPSPAEGPP